MDFVKQLWKIGAIVLTGALSACGGSGGGGDGGAPAPVVDPQSKASIGAAGGKASSPDQRLELTIPAGALGNTTEIVITEVSAANMPANLKPINADKVYRLEPAGAQFAMPVTVAASLPANTDGAIAVMALESNGTGEYPSGQKLTFGASGRVLSGRITHFSNLVVKTVESFTVKLALSSKSIPVGGTLTADVTLSKAASDDAATLQASSFSRSALGPLQVTTDSPPLKGTLFGLQEAKTIAGQLAGTCSDIGNNVVLYNAFIDAEIGGIVGVFGPPSLLPALEIGIPDDFACVAQSGGGGTTIPTGVFKPPFLTKLDGIYAYTGRFANLEGDGPTAFVAGAEGAIAIDLVSRSSKLNWTISGPEGNVLGSPLLGALPVKQPGDNADAVVHGFRNNGTAKRAYDPASWSFGFTEVGFDGVRDATTAGGGIEANSFIEIAPTRGIRFYEFDPATRIYRGGLSPGLGRSLFSGELVSGFLPQQNGYVLGLTRLADNGTKSRVYGHVRVPADAPAVTLFDDDDPQARRMRCAKGSDVTWSCGVSYAGGKARLFKWDPTQPTATPATQSVTTGAGSLGIDVARKANGNAVFVVANFTANSINVIETSPDVATVIGNWQVPAPEGCTNPAHPALVWDDSTGWKVVVTCNGSDSLWVGLLPQG